MHDYSSLDNSSINTIIQVFFFSFVISRGNTSKHTFTRCNTIGAENTYITRHLCISFMEQPWSSCEIVFNAVIIFSRAQCSHNFPRLQNYLWVRWETVIEVKETSGSCKRGGSLFNAAVTRYVEHLHTWDMMSSQLYFHYETVKIPQ